LSTKQKKPVAEVKFTPPPPEREKRYDWDRIADVLRSRPGEWALIFEQDKASIASTIAQNDIRALRSDRGFEVRTSNNKRTSPRTCDLYMRYVPEKDKEGGA